MATHQVKALMDPWISHAADSVIWFLLAYRMRTECMHLVTCHIDEQSGGLLKGLMCCWGVVTSSNGGQSCDALASASIYSGLVVLPGAAAWRRGVATRHCRHYVEPGKSEATSALGNSFHCKRKLWSLNMQ